MKRFQRPELPMMYFNANFVAEGGLICYAANFPDLARRSATYAAKIFGGAKPADLPVEQPTRFELIGQPQAHGGLVIREGDELRVVAAQGQTHFVEAWRQLGPVRPPEGSPPARLIRGERIIHILDARTDDALRNVPPELQRLYEVGGVRTMLIVPLRKEGRVLGLITAYRQEVRPFTDKENCAARKLRGASGHCNGERAVADRDAQSTGAADRNRRGAAGHQLFARRPEVLQVINSSPGDLAPVFDAILAKAHSLCGAASRQSSNSMLDRAAQLCEAAFGSLVTYDGERFQAVALRRVPPAFAEVLQEPFRPDPGTADMRLLDGEPFVHIEDVAAVPRTGPLRQALVETGSARTLLGVPLVKDGVLLGAFMIYRQEVRPFSDKQIALLQNFAAQAVIAMENARLLTETREALEQQTATAEVLQVINSSPGDLTPVFDAILEKEHTLCGAAHGSLTLADGERFRAVALRGMPEEFADVLRQPFYSGALGEQLSAGKPFVQIADLTAAGFSTDDPVHRAAVGPGGVRTLLAVPLRKDGVLLGYITANRQEVRPFSDKQIALLENFAAQAVIAMENARLLTETREALEQQTATAEVLQVINSSPGDLTPVFDAILEKAHTLCGASHGVLATYDGDHFRAVATHELPAPFAELLRQPFRPEPGGPQEQLLRGERLVHVPDASVLTGPGWETPRTRAAREAGLRAFLMLPLRKDGRLLGYITANRHEPGPFTDKQIALLQNFAAQAVIAMENARLINETREALEQQTATAEVLQVINSSPGDLAPVFDAVLDKAMRLCAVDHAALELYDGERMHAVAVHGASERFAETLRRGYPATNSPASRALLEGQRYAEIADAAEVDQVAFRTAAEVDGIRTVLFVPLRRDDALLGMISLARREVRQSSEKEIALLENFAAQAVIAIENARLLGELRSRTAELVHSVEKLQLLSEVGQAVSSALDVRTVLSTILTRSVGMTGADAGAVFRYCLTDRSYRLVEAFGWDDALLRVGRRAAHPGERDRHGRGGGARRADAARRSRRAAERAVARH